MSTAPRPDVAPSGKVWLLQRSEVAGGTKRIIDELEERLRGAGVAASAVFLRDLREHRKAQGSLAHRVAAEVRDAWRLLRLLRRDKPELVVTFTPLLGAALGQLSRLLRGPRVVHTLHQSAAHAGRFARRLDRATARAGGYSAVVACGRAVAESYSREGADYGMIIEVIPNGVPVSELSWSPGSSAGLRDAAGVAPGALVAFAVGRLAAAKNYPMLLEALAGAPCWHLVIAGEGAARAHVEAEIERLGLTDRVRLLGLVPQGEVRLWLAECDGYVLPSSDEGLSLALLEAMSVGAPILASDIPGNREALGDEEGRCGWLLPATEPGRWADALRGLQASPEAASAAGARARERQRREFSEERMYERYVQLVLEQLAK